MQMTANVTIKHGGCNDGVRRQLWVYAGVWVGVRVMVTAMTMGDRVTMRWCATTMTVCDDVRTGNDGCVRMMVRRDE